MLKIILKIVEVILVIVGRVAGRIENGEFSLENKKYEL